MKDKILVIDDDRNLQKLLQLHLRNAGYEIIVATNGTDGLWQLYNHRPDLVLLDILMAEMDGWETCHRIRQLSDVPIIILTALAQEKIKGFQMGADDYITKPFSMTELIARVEARLRRYKRSKDHQSPAVYADKDLTVDFDHHQVTVHGKPVALTPTEFSVLACLVQRAGQVVPHKAILSQVWGEEYIDDVHYLRLYIQNLRGKIEENPGTPKRLVTEWGIGYRFCPA
jgi:DNA-binding response OmpR family regulator